jgi:hypothetical protein
MRTHNLHTFLPRCRELRIVELWPSFLEWWPGVQFPGLLGTVNNGTELVDQDVRDQAWKEAVRKRYDEFDTDDNVLLSRANCCCCCG